MLENPTRMRNLNGANWRHLHVCRWLQFKSKVQTVPWSWEDRPHENLEFLTPPSENVHVPCCSYFWLRSLVLLARCLIPFSIIQAHLPPKFRVILIQLFIWLKYWRFGCESFLHSEFFHLGSLWFLGKLMKSTYIRLVIWLFMTNYKLGWFSFNHFFFPEEQKKWNVYDFSFPFLLCSYRFFSFAIDSEPAIELFVVAWNYYLRFEWFSGIRS